ncbi:MAG: L-seryl-tRNA(Sec) selenium transferase [Pseudomonadota bacterium]
MQTLYRALPSVDSLLAELLPVHPDVPRAMVHEVVTDCLATCRQGIRSGEITDVEELKANTLINTISKQVQASMTPHFRRVLNATGVVIHTNMGRSLLADSAVAAVNEACAHYSNLEFDLATGERGSRYSHVEDLLCRVTGAEAALVVNNNAAAVLLVLDTLCKGGEVIVSRGQLVEIGGSFRIPEVMEKSGALLREVGATNRTHLRDYENAINDQTVALLRVHTSNYRVVGFHKAVPLADLVALGRARNLPVIEDLGSGSFLDFSPWGLPNANGGEPTVQDIVADNPDVITFSGDKVLGGPQAGIIVGRRDWIERIKRNPLNRALRIDKMTLAALEATLRLYLDPERARAEVPTLRMITAAPDELKARARRLATRLRKTLGSRATITTIQGVSRVGGGSFPERDLPTTLVHLVPHSCSVTALRTALLHTSPPLVGRVESGAFLLDPRTLSDNEFALVGNVLDAVLE